MKRRILVLILLIAGLLSVCSCSRRDQNSTFKIQFIDVGQGDAALVACDGHYMLIDGGDEFAGEAVRNVLKENNDIRKLDILAISHLHKDHYGGLSEALEFVDKIRLTISNATELSGYDTDEDNRLNAGSGERLFAKLESKIISKHSKIKVPAVGQKYNLGSATVEVLDVSSQRENDSLVLLITYGDTRFLFTGDIQGAALTRLSNKYQNDADEPDKVDVLKFPHHGSYTEELYRFLRTFDPDAIVISVGKDNKYGHPKQKTLDLINDFWRSHDSEDNLYRTDEDGTICVVSDGKTVTITTEKESCIKP